MSLDDDRWLFDGDAWLEALRADETAAGVKGCGDPDCCCQDEPEEGEPDHSTVTMTDVYDE